MREYEPLFASLESCGLRREGVAVHFDDLLRGEVVTIANIAGARDDMFSCIRAAKWQFRFFLEFEDTQLGERFQEYDLALFREEHLARAIEFLKQQGRYEMLPKFVPGSDPASFVQELERFCGYAAGEVYDERSSSVFVMRRSYILQKAMRDTERFGFLQNAITASQLEKYGISFVIQGNQAYVETEE